MTAPTAPAPLDPRDDRPVPVGRAILTISPDLSREEAAGQCAAWTFREMYHRSPLSWLDMWECEVHALCALETADPGDGRDPYNATHTIAIVRVEWDKSSNLVARSDPDGTMQPAGKGKAAFQACNAEARQRLHATYHALLAEARDPSPEEVAKRRALALIGTDTIAAQALTAPAADVLAALETTEQPTIAADSGALIAVAYLLARVARLDGLSQTERAIVRRLSALLG
jgi:hypothetical protein